MKLFNNILTNKSTFSENFRIIISEIGCGIHWAKAGLIDKFRRKGFRVIYISTIPLQSLNLTVEGVEQYHPLTMFKKISIEDLEDPKTICIIEENQQLFIKPTYTSLDNMYQIIKNPLIKKYLIVNKICYRRNADELRLHGI